jgi:hypothetical protein
MADKRADFHIDKPDKTRIRELVPTLYDHESETDLQFLVREAQNKALFEQRMFLHFLTVMDERIRALEHQGYSEKEINAALVGPLRYVPESGMEPYPLGLGLGFHENEKVNTIILAMCFKKLDLYGGITVQGIQKALQALQNPVASINRILKIPLFNRFSNKPLEPPTPEQLEAFCLAEIEGEQFKNNSLKGMKIAFESENIQDRLLAAADRTFFLSQIGKMPPFGEVNVMGNYKLKKNDCNDYVRLLMRLALGLPKDSEDAAWKRWGNPDEKTLDTKPVANTQTSQRQAVQELLSSSGVFVQVGKPGESQSGELTSEHWFFTAKGVAYDFVGRKGIRKMPLQELLDEQRAKGRVIHRICTPIEQQNPAPQKRIPMPG